MRRIRGAGSGLAGDGQPRPEGAAGPQIIARLRDARAAAETETLLTGLPPQELAEDVQDLILGSDTEDGQVFLPKLMERWFGLSRSKEAAHAAGRGVARW